MDRATANVSDEARGARGLLLDFGARRGRLRQDLREALRSAIQQGRLPAGTVLSASRRLAADLGVSRGVVSDSYDQLACEGYLAVRPRSAPVVAEVAAGLPAVPEPAVPRWRFDFTATTPDVALFPRRAWARAVQRAVANTPDAALDYGDYHGRLELRAALSSYLGRVRGVRIDPGRIVVTQGFTQALDLLCHVLAGSGRVIMAMETPSHPGLWATVRQSGLQLAGCPVDEHGLQPDMLSALGADAVVTAPAHQFPTGAVMAPDRRLALIAWAQAGHGLVIEDDYDAEFRYDRTPIGAIQGLDPGRVAHVGTVSKTLAPGVRLGWISAPAELVDPLVARKSAADSGHRSSTSSPSPTCSHPVSTNGTSPWPAAPTGAAATSSCARWQPKLPGCRSAARPPGCSCSSRSPTTPMMSPSPRQPPPRASTSPHCRRCTWSQARNEACWPASAASPNTRSRPQSKRYGLCSAALARCSRPEHISARSVPMPATPPGPSLPPRSAGIRATTAGWPACVLRSAPG